MNLALDKWDVLGAHFTITMHVRISEFEGGMGMYYSGQLIPLTGALNGAEIAEAISESFMDHSPVCRFNLTSGHDNKEHLVWASIVRCIDPETRFFTADGSVPDHIITDLMALLDSTETEGNRTSSLWRLAGYLHDWDLRTNDRRILFAEYDTRTQIGTGILLRETIFPRPILRRKAPFYGFRLSPEQFKQLCNVW